jgi:tryptophan synthase beta chain
MADENVALVGVEAGGKGIESGQHAARFADARAGRLGVLHGTKTYVLQDAHGQIAPTYSISAGLDYAAVGPEHAWMRDLGRAEYTTATDGEALLALRRLSELEGIIPALESAHAVAEAMQRAPWMRRDQLMVVNISGRGDKDMPAVASALEIEK